MYTTDRVLCPWYISAPPAEASVTERRQRRESISKWILHIKRGKRNLESLIKQGRTLCLFHFGDIKVFYFLSSASFQHHGQQTLLFAWHSVPPASAFLFIYLCIYLILDKLKSGLPHAYFFFVCFLEFTVD